MEWKSVKVPPASIGPKAWRDRAIKAVGLAEAAIEITAHRYQDTPFRSATLFENQARRLARRKGCKYLPGALSENPESLGKFKSRQQRMQREREALEEAKKNVCSVTASTEDLSSDILYKVPEGKDTGWGFKLEMELLPFLRDLCAMQSNEQIGSYMLQTRSVIGHLLDQINRVSSEIFRLKETRDKLRLALADIRKGLVLNRMTNEMRKMRPALEREPDGADLLIGLEKKHLSEIKPSLEEPLHTIKDMLQKLDAARTKLQECYKERMLVIDLVPQLLSQTTKEARTDCLTPRLTKALSEVRDVNLMPSPTPVGPYTYACDKAMNNAKSVIVQSRNVREKSDKLIEDSVVVIKGAQKSVNDGLTQKMAENVAMTQHMEVSSGETRAALNRTQRWYDDMELASGIVLGPVDSRHLMLRERLDRPLVKVYQRHPATQLPEAATLVKGVGVLKDAMAETSRNIEMLKVARKRLNENIRDKKAGFRIDSGIVRFRKLKAPARIHLDESKPLSGN
ncbi:coiled-coil domain-containing protein 105-like isoform X1 [Chiloscyllium plagiosum]|uniref:coiled-coil domain-containing protein 105-like isoform X1 n=1 Tax=Chiloscyllium plagiosum TaxID=36176 RepID=UPI001CB7CC7F|nr:coiled-coil domain-containing protein 105-like isoform X1 [Chiloscyllium plagiosum]XP_043533723.1 coiled-coil domain-containing protein 105-like isoform X1 [Chiloscyllium plagiosum]XP_043533724.1 coiled-coil domain-containing protein 105-like isoform X1 [Chiloscyllium plagiosum]